RRPTRPHPGGDRRRRVPANGLAVHPETGGQLVLGPTRVPMDQDLRYVDHVEGSPRHHASARVQDGGSLPTDAGQTPTPRGRATLGELRDRVGELRDRRALSWGNYVIADNRPARGVAKDHPTTLVPQLRSQLALGVLDLTTPAHQDNQFVRRANRPGIWYR